MYIFITINLIDGRELNDSSDTETKRLCMRHMR